MIVTIQHRQIDKVRAITFHREAFNNKQQPSYNQEHIDEGSISNK